MATITATYLGDLRTTATHTKSGDTLTTDAPTDNRGKGEAFSPTDLVATALGTCVLTVMGIKARDADIDMDGATVSVQKTMGSNPRRILKLEVTVQMPDRDYTGREQQQLTRAAHYCPVDNSLHPDMEVVIEVLF